MSITRVVVAIFTCCLMAAGALGSTFFQDLHEGYLAVLEDVVRHDMGNTNVFSVAVAEDAVPGVSTTYYPLPPDLWNKLRPRLEAKGVNLSTYVTSDQIEVREGRVVTRQGRRPASIYVITGVIWHGGNRLLVSQKFTSGQMSGRGWTLILEMKEGTWSIVGRIKDWVE